MQTSLPNLPFTNHERAELRPYHSSSETNLISRPRTDLEALTPWTSFPDDIHRVIQTATARAGLPPTPFDVETFTGTIRVGEEEGIRAHAMVSLHVIVANIMGMFGTEGYFVLPDSGNLAVVGAPDASWMSNIELERHPKLVVEYTPCDTLGRQSLDALHQIYGYMTFNNNKFGILSNWQRDVFLRRSETSDRRTLEYHLVELDGPDTSISMLKAGVGMVLLAENDWFNAPPTRTSTPLARTSNPAYGMRRGKSKYKRLPVDFHLCRFDISSARQGATCCILYGRLPEGEGEGEDDRRVIYKAVDVLRYPDGADWLEDEVRVYVALQHLQGRVIPTLFGYYEVWGILHVLALEPVGEAIGEGERIDETLRGKMKEALQCIHDAGFVHGDIGRRNFCRTEGGDVFLVDLERCRRVSKDLPELSDEMA
ncbi:hypothetical protein M413DRAFT_20768 [Hebeloma cylindrosporum]|uniref:Protein kinase domain-containing protein n=1 Tax=Hebeloma cylindrosporum TaxID=76867 RepID=A0A0C3BVH2_HEBCY|nr:hypothetical protein M413DRAFT_20768 [Hebeloma cylindrosporum h7]